jgi:hypothetical protein
VVVYEREVEAQTDYIELFDANRDTIRRTKITFEIDSWSTWLSKSGFDHVVIAQKSRRIRVCEVFFLVLYLLLYSTNGTRSIFYSPELGLVFVNQNDGQVFMISYELDF